jgi:hypothetical protein
MQIQGPLVIDVSLWDNHINTDELLAGGVASVIVGLYKQWDKTTGTYVLNDNCKRICEQVKASKLILQTYYYYYPQYDPIKEANWYVDTMFANSLPVAFAWLDAEDHGAIMTPSNRSEQYHKFANQVSSRFSNVGVYTNKAFITGWAPDMDKWLGLYPAWIPHYGYQPLKPILASWEDLKANWLPSNPIYPYNLIISAGQKYVVGHQFTGDRFHLPGVYDNGLTNNTLLYRGRMSLDVSVFTKEFIDSISGDIVPPVIVIPTYTDYRVNVNAVNIRKSPSSSGMWVRYAYLGEILHIEGHLTNGYVQMSDGNWVYQQYLIKLS